MKGYPSLDEVVKTYQCEQELGVGCSILVHHAGGTEACVKGPLVEQLVSDRDYAQRTATGAMIVSRAGCRAACYTKRTR